MMSPLEVNARKLIGVLARHPTGASSEELRLLFEQYTSLNRQSYYNALRFAKAQNWLVGGNGKGELYQLNPDRCWEEPSTGEIPLEEAPLEIARPRDWSAGSDANGVALRNLLGIVSSSTASPRQKIRACGAILSYKVEDPAVIEFVKSFLESLVANGDIATDYRIMAGELLRQHEAPRIKADTVAPDYRENVEPTGPPPIPLPQLLEERRRYCDERQREMARELERERLEFASKSVPGSHNGNGR